MRESTCYQRAYERERLARLEAERLLDEKTRELYQNVVTLEATVTQLKKTQEQLIHSEKMASVGQLVAGVAHEINNPVGFVLSNTETAKEYFSNLLALDDYVMRTLFPKMDEAVAQGYLQQREKLDVSYLAEDVPSLMADSVEGLTRIKGIVTSLKSVSHPGNNDFDNCDVNECIDQSLKMVNNELKYKMRVHKQLEPVPQIKAQFSQLQQVLINMFVNAAHACDVEGDLNIKTYCACQHGQQGIVIQVEDNGHGMNENVRRRIFDPFYTTKTVGQGTGLGLSISFGIIEKHQGHIAVQSAPGQGTTFCIFLPVAMKEQMLEQRH